MKAQTTLLFTFCAARDYSTHTLHLEPAHHLATGRITVLKPNSTYSQHTVSTLRLPAQFLLMLLSLIATPNRLSRSLILSN